MAVATVGGGMSLFEHPQRLMALSGLLLIGGLAMLLVGVVLAYGLEARLSIPALLLAHLMTILGPTLIKLGYVLRLHVLHRLARQG